MKQEEIEKRRQHVEELYFLRGVPLDVIAELLGCLKQTVRDDCQIIKERLIEKAQMTSEGAVEAVEEVAALLGIAHSAIHEAEFMQYPKVGEDQPFRDRIEAKARLLDTAARCLFLAGRLKQGKDQ